MTSWNVLHNELLTTIMIIVASNDIKDYFRMKTVCRGWRDVDEEKDVLPYITLDNFYNHRFTGGIAYSEWFKLLVHAKNPEALFYDGVERFKQYPMDPRCLTPLKQAKKLRFNPAIYAYGLVILVHGDREKADRAFEKLNPEGQTESEFLTLVEFCRDKCKQANRALGIMNSHKHAILTQNLTCCCKEDCALRDKDVQRFHELSLICRCYAECFWDHEAALLFGSEIMPP